MSVTFEGGPCRRAGHTTRYRTRGHCVECAKAASKRLQATRARWYEANREKKMASAREWRQANPAGVQAWSRNRSARKKGGIGRLSTADQREILAESLGICAYCNERRPLELDHIEPLARGGAHNRENTAAACKRCNASKRDKPLIIWLAQRQKD